MLILQPFTGDSRAAVVHLNFRAGSTFLVLVCTETPGHWVNKAGLAGATRLTWSDFRFNLLLLKDQKCVDCHMKNIRLKADWFYLKGVFIEN